MCAGDMNTYPLQDLVQRPRETRYQFEPSAAGCSTQELCVQLSLDPRKTNHRRMSTPSPSATAGGAAMSMTPTQSSPQLSGIWADRSHVIRPYLPTTPTRDSLRRPLLAPSPPGTPGEEPSREPVASREKPPQRSGPPVVASLKGAWSQPGSGAAVVRSSTAPRVRPRSPPIDARRRLQHSVSGPVARQGANVGRSHRESGYEQTSRDQRSHGQQRSHDQQWRPHDPQHRSPHRVRSRGERSSAPAKQQRHVYPISEQEGEGPGYQRSCSTTQAHQNQSDRRSQSSRKPYSEPS